MVSAVGYLTDLCISCTSNCVPHTPSCISTTLKAKGSAVVYMRNEIMYYIEMHSVAVYPSVRVVTSCVLTLVASGFLPSLGSVQMKLVDEFKHTR